MPRKAVCLQLAGPISHAALPGGARRVLIHGGDGSSADHPISDFHNRHFAALWGLFGQVLTLCREAGLAELGHVMLDGIKVKANASKHKAMSYTRVVKAEVLWKLRLQRGYSGCRCRMRLRMPSTMVIWWRRDAGVGWPISNGD
ncbi:MAG: hypothetical protein M2R45_01223 [Verrucomicrobia subdivision 3 bacterium]|nr:hypothetical protein [Limisphaerales bacterium]MCS1415225.1 hypothetical protein [Limisphaerales bacterium]